MKPVKYFKLSALFLLLFCFACKKPPGPGGYASIKGKVWVEDWNTAFTVKNSEYAGADQDVYIVYGDEVGYGDRIRADYNGEFKFNYLREGKYKVYVYSKDKTLQSPSGSVAVVKEIEITQKKQEAELETIVIYE